jgi:hypothetical protein
VHVEAKNGRRDYQHGNIGDAMRIRAARAFRFLSGGHLWADKNPSQCRPVCELSIAAIDCENRCLEDGMKLRS